MKGVLVSSLDEQQAERTRLLIEKAPWAALAWRGSVVRAGVMCSLGLLKAQRCRLAPQGTVHCDMNYGHGFRRQVGPQ